MIVLTIRTDNETAEAGLYKNARPLAYKKWHGHRQLSVTIHEQIEKLLKDNRLDWQDLGAVIFFAGPGSFTGLRIGASLASTLAAGLDIPIVSTKGKDWIKLGFKKLDSGKDEKTAQIFYGAKPHVTRQKK
jgi:tRNA threonylcarbamoyladenosine biosynthesis protein TsaB